MFKFWQRDPKSIENTCSFFANTCFVCARLWDPLLRPDARPICILNSYDFAEAERYYYEGNPYAYDLPEWDPLGCSEFAAK